MTQRRLVTTLILVVSLFSVTRALGLRLRGISILARIKVSFSSRESMRSLWRCHRQSPLLLWWQES